ncbi:MAG TPA: PadR family transcriptional regulator [Firmicutes bacterium]|nr:PadR family transcriptional regulator [Bacillota bacterium]
MLKYGILGLLNYKDLTGYEINASFHDSLSFFWNASKSQIYRELNKMEKEGLVSSSLIKGNGKPDKKVMSITSKGKEELTNFLKTKTPLFSRSPLLLQVFFMASLNKEERIDYFSCLIEESKKSLSSLSKASSLIKEYSSYIDLKNNDPMYWGFTLEYGILMEKTILSWASSCLERIKNESSLD